MTTGRSRPAPPAAGFSAPPRSTPVRQKGSQLSVIWIGFAGFATGVLVLMVFRNIPGQPARAGAHNAASAEEIVVATSGFLQSDKAGRQLASNWQSAGLLGNLRRLGFQSRVVSQVADSDQQLRQALKAAQRKLADGLNNLMAQEAALSAALQDLETARKTVHVYVMEGGATGSPPPSPQANENEGEEYDSEPPPAEPTKSISEIPSGTLKVVNLEARLAAMVEENLVKRVRECQDLKCECQDLERQLSRAWQAWFQEGWEVQWWEHARNSVAELAQKEKWFKEKGLTVEQLHEEVKRMNRPGAEDDYLYLMRMFGHLYNRINSSESISAVVVELEEQQDRETIARNRRFKIESEVATCAARLLRNCGIELPRLNWTKRHDEALAARSLLIAQHQGVHDCVEWDDVDPAARTQPALLAPAELWQRDWERYPNKPINLTFILLYFNHPDTLPTIVDRLYSCTNGMLGTGQLPGVTSDMIVVVDEPGHPQMWEDAIRRTAPGDFLNPFFGNNLHENRGYNRAARAARGDIFIILQDDDMPPENCSWVANTLRAFAAFPRLGEVGMKGGKFAHNKVLPNNEVDLRRWAWEEPRMRMRDPVSGLRLQFVSVVDFAPAAFRRRAFLEVGGLDEALGHKGGTGIFSDYHVSLRLWLAGYQVAMLYMEKHSRVETAGAGGTHISASLGSYLRRLNMELNHWGLATIMDFEKRIMAEVKRANNALQNLDEMAE